MKQFFWKDKTGRGFSGTHTLKTILQGEDDENRDGDSLHEWAKSAEQGDEWENATDVFVCTKSKDERAKVNLRDVNESLYNALAALWRSHVEMGGECDYPEKDREQISDTLDIIEIKYLGREPDGDAQHRLKENGEPMLTDLQAYNELLTRFNNTRI